MSMLTSQVFGLIQAGTANTGDNSALGFIAWLVVGLIAGFLASKIVNKTGEGLLLDIVLGIVGAFVGGFLFRLIGFSSGGGLIYSIIVATIGAVIVLVLWHAIRRRA